MNQFVKMCQRAKRRKSLWNLILIPFTIVYMFLLTKYFFLIMWNVHTIIYPQHSDMLSGFWNEGISLSAFIPSFLLSAPLFFAAIPLSLIFTNVSVWFIVPLRKIFEKETQGFKGTSFKDSMKILLKISYITVPICLISSLIGAVLLKNLY
jgi:hypothetical protein